MKIIPKLEKTWNKQLKNEINKTYFKKIEIKIQDDIKKWIIIYPDTKNIFKAFDKTPFEKIKVVIIWQDPYHGKWQAQWFCFSVPNWIKLPPSLKNIYKELNKSLWIDISKSGDLTPWTEQWVFLLNTILTVQDWKPGSHSKIGWDIFTDYVIKNISDNKEWIIFLLWWAFAKSKKKLINNSKHYILETSHPSPFSVYRWFLWSNCFIETNKILKKEWKSEINWEIK